MTTLPNTRPTAVGVDHHQGMVDLLDDVLTDAEWAQLEPLIPPPKPGGRPRDVDMRAILDAAFYVHRSSTPWRALPLHFPPWQTVYDYVRLWRRDGVWARMLAALGEENH